MASESIEQAKASLSEASSLYGLSQAARAQGTKERQAWAIRRRP